jgi:DNA (cytosine-5)-methyltransferase 1
MPAYYNEIDPYAAQWLRNLIAAGLIAPGDVDTRSIEEVQADDIRGYTQCHFFAGIGGWSLALRLAGWPDSRPLWTGSCPCQPFSAAGSGKASNDERHLWPAWFSIIAECRPAIVFGEQVEAAIGWGWLDAVFSDLEGEGYACGATVLPACSVGAPHIRQRAWFVADTGRSRDERRSRPGETSSPPRQIEGEAPQRERGRLAIRPGGTFSELADAHGGDAGSEGLQRGREHGQRPEDGRARDGLLGVTASVGRSWIGAQPEHGQPRQAGQGSGGWAGADWLDCVDGKARPVEPGTFPLAHGIPRRVGRLRAYGNAIVPQVAAEFIGAYLDLTSLKEAS